LILLLAFLLPLAVYLLVLGGVNRRPHPVVVSGVWDFIGLLFAASGFLLVGGPAILSGLNERWRRWWLLGEGGASAATADGGWHFWVFLSVLYFGVVVGGAAWLLLRRRHLTAIYNVSLTAVEQSLAEVCRQLGVHPVRSGNLFLFNIVVGPAPDPPTGIQEGLPVKDPFPLPSAAKGQDPLGQAAVLEVDSFAAMNHVTLRWDPADQPLRRAVEAELTRRLAETPGPDSELGGWLLFVGLTFLGMCLMVAVALLLGRLLGR
jgi:hypothetical protein